MTRWLTIRETSAAITSQLPEPSQLANLGKVRAPGAPVASIGGAGTFDGVFLTGIIAVLLAAFL